MRDETSALLRGHTTTDRGCLFLRARRRGLAGFSEFRGEKGTGRGGFLPVRQRREGRGRPGEGRGEETKLSTRPHRSARLALPCLHAT